MNTTFCWTQDLMETSIRELYTLPQLVNARLGSFIF